MDTSIIQPLLALRNNLQLAELLAVAAPPPAQTDQPPAAKSDKSVPPVRKADPQGPDIAAIVAAALGARDTALKALAAKGGTMASVAQALQAANSPLAAAQTVIAPPVTTLVVDAPVREAPAGVKAPPKAPPAKKSKK